MSIFGDIGLDSADIPEANAGLPAGQYVGNLHTVKVLDLKSGKGVGRQIQFMYNVNDPAGNPHNGRKQSEFFRIPPAGVKVGSEQWNAIVATEREKITNGMSWLKNRLKTLGVPPEQLATVDPNSLVGIEVIFTVVINSGYSNISNAVNRAAANALTSGNNSFGGASATTVTPPANAGAADW